MNGGLNFLLSTDEREWRFLFYYFVKIDDGQLHNKSVPSHWYQLQGRRKRRQRWHLLSRENQRSHLSLDAHMHKVRQVSQFLPSMLSAMFTLKRKSYSLSWTSILSHCSGSFWFLRWFFSVETSSLSPCLRASTKPDSCLKDLLIEIEIPDLKYRICD